MKNTTTTAKNPAALAAEIIASWRAQDHNAYDKYIAAADAYYDNLRGPSSPRDPGFIAMRAAQKDAQRSLKMRYCIRRARARRAEAEARRWRDLGLRYGSPAEQHRYGQRWAHARAELARLEDAADHLMSLTGLSF